MLDNLYQTKLSVYKRTEVPRLHLLFFWNSEMFVMFGLP